jgi:hemerythrin-like domain-containing protein
MTLTQPRSHQLRLPGQAAAHDGPSNLMNMYLAHHAFRRDLAAFATAVPLTPVEDREAWQALAERWAMFAEVLHHHHKAEDDWLWPLLAERADAEGRATLEAMEAEHEQIDPTLEACAAGFARLAQRADLDARSALSVRLTAVREGLGRHLVHEETDAIRLVQTLLTAEDWAAFEKRIEDTIRFSQVLRLVPWVMHELPHPAREQVFAETGTAHRLLWRLTRRKFERLDNRAFRHLR